MATGANDANGIWQYGEDDSNTTFSALLNRLGASTSTAIGLIKNDSKGILTATSGGTNGLTYFKLTSNFSTSSTASAVDITGTSMTFTAVAGRLYRASFAAYMDGTPSAGRFEVKVTDGSNNVLRFYQDQVNTLWNRVTFSNEYQFTATGSTTLKLRMNAVDAGTYTISGSTGYNLFWIIEDIGKA